MELDFRITPFSKIENNKFLDSIDYEDLDKYTKKYLENILQMLVMYKRKKEIEILLKYGIDPDCKTSIFLGLVPTLYIVTQNREYGNYTVLYSGEIYGDDYEIMELFLKNGACLIERKKLFKIALENRKFEICKVIIKYVKSMEEILKDDINLVNHMILHKIIKSGNLDLFKSILRKMDPDLINFEKYCQPIYHFLLKNKNNEAMKLVVKHGFDLNNTNNVFCALSYEKKIKIKKKVNQIIEDVKTECRKLNILFISHYKEENTFFHNSNFPLDLLKIVIKMTGLSYPVLSPFKKIKNVK